MKRLLFFGLLSLLLPGNISAQNDRQTTASAKTGGEEGSELTPYQRVSMYLGHSLFKADPIKRQSEILWGIKGVKPVLEVSEELGGDFSTAALESKIYSALQAKSIPIDKENGALLLFRIRGVWDRGKRSLAYTYDLDIVDKVYVLRDGQIKSNFRSIWNVTNMGFAGKDVYENAMLINIESAVERFGISFYEQLDRDIITDTPRQAKLIYQRIRNGEEDITDLLANEELKD